MLGALTSLLIARELGPAGRGTWGIIASMAVLTGTLVSIGLPAGAAYAAARLEGAKRHLVVRAALACAVVLGAVAAVLTAAALWLVAPVDVSVALALISALISASLLVSLVCHQVLLTTAALGWYAASLALPAGVMLVVVAILSATTRLDVEGVALASAGSTAIGAGFAWVVLRRRLPAGHRGMLRPGEVAGALRPWIAFALLTFATSALTQVVQRVDLLIVGGYRGTTEAGLYAVAVQVGDMLLILPAAVGFVLFRRGATSADGHWEDALVALRWTALVGTAAAIAVGLAAGWLVPFAFGETYAGSVTALRLLLPGIVLLGLQSLVSSYVASRGRPRAVLVAWLVAAVVGIVGDLIVVPERGLEGAAVVASFSYLLVLGLHVRPLLAVRPGAQA